MELKVRPPSPERIAAMQKVMRTLKNMRAELEKKATRH
jgi:hypothetical protein